MINLKDKVAVVFAATGAIGRTVARAFAHHGAKVYVTGRRITDLQHTADGIQANEGWAEAHALILKDVYQFFLNNICLISQKTEGVVKHLLITAR